MFLMIEMFIVIETFYLKVVTVLKSSTKRNKVYLYVRQTSL